MEQTPKGIKISENDAKLIIEIKWFSIVAFIILLYSCFWFFIAYSLYNMFVSTNILFLSILGYIILFTSTVVWYYSFAIFINRTFISVSNEKIEIRHTPLPYFGQKSIYIRNLERIYTKERLIYAKGRTVRRYEIHGIYNDGQDIKIFNDIDGVITSTQMYFIESKISKFIFSQ